MKICTFHQSFTKRSEWDNPQCHRKGKGYHTDDDKTVWQRCQQCQKTSHHPHQGQYFDCSEASPAPCCHTVTIPSPVSFQLPTVLCQGWGESVHTAPRSCTRINSELGMLEEKLPKGRVKNTTRYRCDHSGWLQHITTAGTAPQGPLKHLSLLALSFLVPNRAFLLPLTHQTGTRACGRKSVRLCSEKLLGDGDGGTKSKAQDSWMLDILPAGSCRGMSNVMAQPLSFLGHVLCLYFHLDLYPRPAPLPVARSSKQFWALQCLLQASSFSGILFAITRILLVLCYGTGMQLSFCEGTKWEGRKVWGSVIRFLMTFPLATLQHMLVVQKNWVRCPICCSLSPRVTNVHIHVFFPCRFLEHQTRSL